MPPIVLTVVLFMGEPPSSQPAPQPTSQPGRRAASRAAASQPAQPPDPALVALLAAGEKERQVRIAAVKLEISQLQRGKAVRTSIAGQRWTWDKLSPESLAREVTRLRAGIRALERMKDRFLPTLEWRADSIGLGRREVFETEPFWNTCIDERRAAESFGFWRYAKVIQVVDEANLIAEVEDRELWITGIETAALVDDDVFPLSGIWRVTGTKTFERRTMLVLEQVDIDLSPLDPPPPRDKNGPTPSGARAPKPKP